MKRKSLIIVFLFLYSIQTTISQNVDIPDSTFKNLLLNYSPTIDTNNDGEIQVSEAEAVIELDISGPNYTTSGGINSLTGIEKFINLTLLNCKHNDIEDLNISTLTLLETLICFDNNLDELNINNNTKLKNLECGSNQFTSLNLEFNTQLEVFKVFQSNLESISFNSNTLIKEIVLASDITSIDLSNNLDLERLVLIFSQPFNQINLSNNTKIKSLRLEKTQIQSLGFLSDLTNLESIALYENNELASINLSNNTKLNKFEFFNLQNLVSINLRNDNNNLITPGNSVIENLSKLESMCVDDVNSPPDFVEMGTIGNYTFTENCNSLSTNSNLVKDEILIYPNPVNDNLLIKNKEVKEIIIYNINGMIILKNSNSNKINLQHLALGFYFTKIIFKDNSIYTDKIIKQ